MADPVIDESLYSRQLYVIGVEAMKKIAASSVLISGLGGLGVETAKNVILAGVKNVTIHDRRVAELSDLASNFYLSPASIGENRAIACLGQLSSLNDYVTVAARTDELTDEFLLNYQCVVITDARPEAEIERIASFCHAQNIKFILAETRGVFGYVFVDNGVNHTIVDPAGEQPSRSILSFVTRAEEALVTIAPEEAHGLGDDDFVRFDEVEGMTELNGNVYPVAEVVSTRQFRIQCDTREFGEYSSAKRPGFVSQVFPPKTVAYLSLAEALRDREKFGDPFDWGAMESQRDQQVVLSFLAAQRVFKGDALAVDADELLAAANALNADLQLVEKVDEALVREFARESGAVICPTCAAFGGIVGNEILKSVSGKFTPINQFLAVGYIEALPPAPIEYTLKGDRYDPYRIVFGDATQDVIQGLRYFLIGAGALGCEQLKNWALMGVATRGDGRVFVTDMDQIERSNLNRQFLFRNSDIGRMKSEAAAAAAVAMNPEFRVDAHANRIGAESAHIYHDAFYQSLSGVCNALDNVATRLFSDQQCVRYGRPLLESGTLGPKAHLQVVVPNLTESYGSQQDPPEQGIPMCTLHHFPANINHTTMWARDKFGGLFEKDPASVNSFIEGKTEIEKLRREDIATLLGILQAAERFLITEKTETVTECVRWARLKFEEYFNFAIRDLQAQFPADLVTDQGLPFWGGAKRYPSPVEFDPANPLHADFVRSAAVLRARVFGVEPPDPSSVPGLAASVTVPSWAQSGSTVTLPEGDSGSTPPPPSADIDSFSKVDSLLERLRPFIGTERRFVVEEFEKDDDTNGHIEFIAAGANIRAINYEIEPKDKLEIKKIAGKIVPAIATTTAMVEGFLALEMYKVHAIVPKKLEDFRFATINLATNMFAFSEPRPCTETTCPSNGLTYTLWTHWIIEGDLTLGEFLAAVESKYRVTVDMMTVGNALLYMSFEPKKAQERANKKITEILVKEFDQPPLVPGQNLIALDITAVDEEGADVDTPPFFLKVA
jgi:ubiquitin-activating enzyme E1